MSERKKIAFIGSECHPFVKTGGLGDVMYALPRSLVKMDCDVRVILPRYACIPQRYQEQMVWRGSFPMDLGETGQRRHFLVRHKTNEVDFILMSYVFQCLFFVKFPSLLSGNDQLVVVGELAECLKQYIQPLVVADETEEKKILHPFP